MHYKLLVKVYFIKVARVRFGKAVKVMENMYKCPDY